MTIASGTRLGPYEVVAPLGAGGMGEVYRAVDPRLGRAVALKVLPSAFASAPERLARFEREARVASSLNHPNIVTIYDIGQHDAVTYFAMELVEGETLAARLTAGRLSIRESVGIAAQIASGLAAAHGSGVVHRDIKPQNVMLTREGLVKILDFGLGKLTPLLVDSQSSISTAERFTTRPGAVQGTTEYMSPEQATGREVDFRSDQFSFGTVLYEMIAGTRPFRRESPVQTLASIIEADPDPLPAQRPEIPEHLVGIVTRCLAKRPEQRYGSTVDLARDLEDLRNHLRVGTLSGTVASRARAGQRLVALAVVMTLVVVAALVMLSRFARLGESPGLLPAEKRLAILAFANVGGDPAGQAFSDGLVEVLTTKLTQLEQFQGALHVVPASEVRRERVASAREARQSFGVGLVLTGSIQRTGDTVRLTINLVDAKTLLQVRARSIDATVREASALEDEVLGEVARLIEVEVAPRARPLLTAGATSVPSAYDYYLQGRGYLQRYESADNVRNAIGLFKRALADDGKFALAHAALGEAFWRQYDLTKDAALVTAARESCETALRLDDKLPQVHITLGLIDNGTGAYEEAVRHVQRALAIDPLRTEAYRVLGGAYQGLGRFDLADATYRKAIEVRPSDWSAHNALGAFYAARGRSEDAAREFQRVIELTPDNTRAYTNLGGVYVNLRRYDEAARMLEKSLSIRPTNTAYSNLATVYFRQGRYTDAARMFERARQPDESNYRIWRNLGWAYYWAPGERDRARAAFERAATLAEAERAVNPRRPLLLAQLGDCYAILGRHARARDLLRQALKLAPKDTGVLVTAGGAYEQIGDRTRALDCINSAVRLGSAVDDIVRSPTFVALRKDPRFKPVP